MKLYLSGGGKRLFNLDDMFIQDIDKSKPLLYIPIAIDKIKHPYPECLEWIKKYFTKFGLGNIKMVTDLRKITEKDIEKYGSVYIGGGNTPYLLKEMRESGFLKILKQIIEKGIPVAGGSAGAIIHAKTIIPSLESDENKVRLIDFTAMNNLRGYEMDCHYEPSMDNSIRKYMKVNNMKKLIALPEYCGLFVDGEKIQVIGEHSAWVFNKDEKKEIKNREFVE